MRYPGGKNAGGAWQRIVNQIPPHRLYVEPFLGSGAVMRGKRPAERSIGIDLDPAAIAAFRDASCGLPGLELRVGCGIAFLESLSSSPRPAPPAPRPDQIVVYCDPPYLMSTRSGKRLYKHELSTEDHRRLLAVLVELPCRVIVSGYWSELYAKKLAGWRVETFAMMTRGGRPATERLWMNFAESVELHDYRWLGNTFRARERFHRQQRRWVGRLARMDRLARQALLSAIESAKG